MNWKANIMISIQHGQEFIVKATGTFLNKYVLENKNQQKPMLLNPSAISAIVGVVSSMCVAHQRSRRVLTAPHQILP